MKNLPSAARQAKIRERFAEFFAMTASDLEAFSSLEWGRVDLSRVPHLPGPPPGPQSKHYHDRCTKHFKGLSSGVKLFPVSFESGSGCVRRDVDGNDYIDFSSGIYVTTLGHCHNEHSFLGGSENIERAVALATARLAADASQAPRFYDMFYAPDAASL